MSYTTRGSPFELPQSRLNSESTELTRPLAKQAIQGRPAIRAVEAVAKGAMKGSPAIRVVVEGILS